jgi:hypothetical protein
MADFRNMGMGEPKENEVSNVNDKPKPKCDAERRREEILDTLLEGVAALRAGVDALSRRMDAVEREKAEAEPLKYTS